MSHSDYRTLLDRGRKAGLRTSDLYAALASRRTGAADPPVGQLDGNGYVPAHDREGHRVYRPNASAELS